MAKANKKKPAERKKRGKYDDKVAVKANFLEILQAAVKDANNKSEKPKE